MQRPVIAMLAALILGISGGSIFRMPDLPVQLALAISLLLIFASLRSNWRRFIWILMLVPFILLGFLQTNLLFHRVPGPGHLAHFLSPDKASVEGIVCENPRVSPDKTELVVCASRIIRAGNYQDAAGRVLLSIREPYPFHYGDVIRFHSRLRLPRNFGNPGAFDYERYLRLRGIFVRGFVNDTSNFVILRREAGAPARTRLERFRDRLRETILEYSPGFEGKVIQAMILGDQEGIPAEIMEKFNRTGTTHIIAISGFNIGIVAIFSLFVVRLLCRASEYLLLRWNVNRLATLFAILVVILYTFIAGAGISVVRASLMVVAFMVSVLLNRQRDLFNTLAMAALLILIVSPASLFDISFQLSFAAVASLLVLMPRLTALLPASLLDDASEPGLHAALLRLLKRGLRATLIFIFVTLSATVGTLPLILFYFNRLSLVSLIANLIVVPILGIMATPVCLLVVLATPISTLLAEIVIRSAALLVSVALFLIDWFASLSWSSEFICTPSPFEIGAFYLLLVFCVNRYDRWRDRNLPMSPRNLTWLWKLVPLFLMVFLIIDAIQISSQSRHAGTLSLTAVDVGQGSSILVRFPGGKRMLVDGGGFFDETFDIGKLVLAPFLWQQRIGTIDTVVLTHSHPDHLQGLLFILEHFGVREVWTNGRPTDSPLYSIFLEIIGRRGINLKVCSSDLPEMQFFGTKIRILNPVVRNESSLGVEGYAKGAADQLPFRPATSAPGRPLSKEDPNDLSLVIRISYGSRHFLLPGDITERTERQILQSGHTLASDVLFVPHHGGARSSHPAFLERVSPEVAIVSCGADNVFGLPQPEVLRRYAQIHCRLYRTDRDGAVTVTTDGQALTTHLFRTGQR